MTLVHPMKTMETTDKRAERRYIKNFTMDVCDSLSGRITSWLFGKLNGL